MQVPARLKRRPHIPFFRIFYSTTFTALLLLLVALLLISPGDHIFQSFDARQIYHIFIVGGFYLLTLITAVLVYGWRLYQTRSALASIPREWMISEGKGFGMKLGKVGKVIQSGLERSARVAYEGRPRDLGEEKTGRNTEAGESIERLSEKSGGSKQPVWGTISHPGWSSPSSTDLPNLHYEPVILELPHLIEAKAVSLAPPDPLYNSEADANPDEPPTPDPIIVAALQRPASMGLREYIAHLTTLNVIQLPGLGGEFLVIYEQARFSGEELNELEFRGMMSVFAELLRNITALDPVTVDELHSEADYELRVEESIVDETDKKSFMTNETVEHTPQPDVWVSAQPDVWTSNSDSSTSIDGSQQTHHTAPSRPRATGNDSNYSKTTRASVRTGLHTPSMASLRPVISHGSSSGYSGRSAADSVIRLAEARTSLDLPYEIVTGDEQGR